MTETTENTEPSAGERTQQRLLDIAVEIARRDGIEQVTHKTVAAAADLSPSNVTYHFGRAVELRRAAAIKIIGEAETNGFKPGWPSIKRTGDWLAAERTGDPPVVSGNLPLAEAYVWLARNGAGT